MLVVKTPRLPDDLRNYQGANYCFKAEVRVSSGRAGTCSAPLSFFYIPNSKEVVNAILFFGSNQQCIQYLHDHSAHFCPLCTPGMCQTCKQPLPPSLPVQQTPPFGSVFLPPHCNLPPAAISGVSFASGSTPPQQSQSGTPLQPFQSQVPFAPRPQIVSSPATLSHPPSVSSPSSIPTSSSSQKDNFPGMFGTSNQQSPTLTPTSSPGPGNNSSSYWDAVDITPTLPPIPASSIGQDITIGPIIPGDFPTVSTSAPMQLVTSPGSETVYSAAPSPDTTSIFPPYSYMDNSNAPYNQFTS